MPRHLFRYVWQCLHSHLPLLCCRGKKVSDSDLKPSKKQETVSRLGASVPDAGRTLCRSAAAPANAAAGLSTGTTRTVCSASDDAAPILPPLAAVPYTVPQQAGHHWILSRASRKQAESWGCDIMKPPVDLTSRRTRTSILEIGELYKYVQSPISKFCCLHIP